jgi:glutathione peroxidase
MVMTVFAFSSKTITGELKSLSDFAGKVLLIVNTASQCGFTPQYGELQALYEKYHDQGFEVFAFPCNQFMHQEPGTAQDIQQFCQVNYGVTFPIFDKVDVRGKDAHPLFQYLKEQSPGFFSKQIKWNFTKFLINQQGEVVDRFAPNTTPMKIEKDIENLLKINQ